MQLKLFKKLQDSRGDTIVEVLIAIAVVSLTLTGAFVSVNRSANATRTAQERGEALKWAETQVEQIKAADSDLAKPANTKFCFDVDNTTNPTSLTFKNNVTAATACTTGSGVQYKAIIYQDPNPANLGKFSVIVTWDALNTGGGTVNNVELDYQK